MKGKPGLRLGRNGLLGQMSALYEELETLAMTIVAAREASNPSDLATSGED